MSSSHPQALHIAGARRAHARKSLHCTFPECPKMFYAQSGLTQHILRKHQASREPTPPPSFSPDRHGNAMEDQNEFDFMDNDDWPWDNDDVAPAEAPALSGNRDTGDSSR